MATPPGKEFETAIVWFRRDLRVDDNPALLAAIQAATNVVPVFVWAPEEEGQFQPGRCSRWWSKHSLMDLQQALAALGSRLVVRRSPDTTRELLAVAKETGATAVFFNHLYDPISLMRDHDVKRALAAASVAYRSFNGDMLYEPWEVLDEEKQPVSTFKDFWSRIQAMPYPPPFPAAAPPVMPPLDPSVKSLAVSDVDWFFTAEQEASSEQLKFKWKPGVGGAISELEDFLGQRLYSFEHDRAKVDRDSTSRLSPWIHIGSISVRYIFYRVQQCQAQWLAAGEDRRQSCQDFLQQMGYREYGRYLSFHFPFILERSLLSHLRACPWRIDQVSFKAWRQGQTGYPIVDAAMRQLWSSGWCHNRGRVVAASFLVKNLLLPWQWGLKHFWDSQIDADLECDSLGWQYVSGGMSDAHPFSYMMDLRKEAARFDPDGEYVRRWLPVLSRLPTAYIHSPWMAPAEVLAAADVELGCNYPMPIISPQEARNNVDYACSVLDKCVVQQSESSGRNPYRLPTNPAGLSSGPNPNPSAVNHRDQRGGTDTGGTPVRGAVTPTATGGANDAGGGSGGAAAYGSNPESRTASFAQNGPYNGPNSGSGQDQAAPRAPGSGDAHEAAPGGRTAAPGTAQPSHAEGPQHYPYHPYQHGRVQPSVYYQPGNYSSAGHQLLEQILQQQGRSRAHGPARHIEGSGTDGPIVHQERPESYPPPHQPWGHGRAAHPHPPPGMMMMMDGGTEGTDSMQFNPAAFAAYEAMRRRRQVDVVSGVAGDDDDAEVYDEDSEEVVSNTVDLGCTMATGASNLPVRGTARWAQAEAGLRKRRHQVPDMEPDISGATVPGWRGEAEVDDDESGGGTAQDDSTSAGPHGSGEGEGERQTAGDDIGDDVDAHMDDADGADEVAAGAEMAGAAHTGGLKRRHSALEEDKDQEGPT